jgi:hypothetical protein
MASEKTIGNADRDKVLAIAVEDNGGFIAIGKVSGLVDIWTLPKGGERGVKQTL